MNLMSMTDFVLEQSKKRDNDNFYYESDEYFNLCENYAQFLKQPLTLGMFVIVDKNGNILQEPQSSNPDDATNPYFIEEMRLYHEAKENILFKDVSIIKASKTILNIYIKKEIAVVYNSALKTFSVSNNIDELCYLWNKRNINQFNIELTESAINQIGC